MFEHIKRDLQLYITEEEYDNWLASKDLWEKYLKNNEENLKNKKKKKSEE
ncbi:MAG: hypothetical protein LBU14_01410 [Candidatus Peribacteria bacterium]|jgi:hypothetical protein|nr:hypothetical protein [Candidatus Peribacteria bacterium]